MFRRSHKIFFGSIISQAFARIKPPIFKNSERHLFLQDLSKFKTLNKMKKRIYNCHMETSATYDLNDELQLDRLAAALNSTVRRKMLRLLGENSFQNKYFDAEKQQRRTRRFPRPALYFYLHCSVIRLPNPCRHSIRSFPLCRACVCSDPVLFRMATTRFSTRPLS